MKSEQPQLLKAITGLVRLINPCNLHSRGKTHKCDTKNKIEVHVLLRTISDDQTAIKGLTQADKQNTRISVVKGQPDEISTYIARRSKRLHQ